ncbi:MAG: hypothetical protein K0R38_4199 [Polyangiaceae bacterium]|nr:hypothetical protein [Polyangiaceae bacterium]
MASSTLMTVGVEKPASSTALRIALGSTGLVKAISTSVPPTKSVPSLGLPNSSKPSEKMVRPSDRAIQYLRTAMKS